LVGCSTDGPPRSQMVAHGHWLISCPDSIRIHVVTPDEEVPVPNNETSRLPQVLVVDDNRDNIAIMRDFLNVRGYSVTVAYDGNEALRKFNEIRPSIVLLDVMMPGKSGWEVCRLIREAAPPEHNVRIIMVTALDQWEDKRQALLDGADDYLEKPFALADLAATVERNAARLSEPG
ncbi:MAG TPA: response regulator, partial [Gemmatimonadales bacterium]|nr:response regulator [Gemmatimonadales bacterium]